MYITQIKEDLSVSYISALCAYAGISYEIERHDDDSSDGRLKKTFLLQNDMCHAELRVQLKCTSSKSQYTDNGESIIYKLKVKNYNDLCTPSTTPIILALLILPEDKEEWLNWTKDELILKGCMYWADFPRKEFSTNKETVTVEIKKSKVLNNETLNSIMEKIAMEALK